MVQVETTVRGSKAKEEERFRLQSAEFDAVSLLSVAYRSLTLTPIVDDSYPEVRQRYENAMRGLIDAIRANGRLPEGRPGIARLILGE